MSKSVTNKKRIIKFGAAEWFLLVGLVSVAVVAYVIFAIPAISELIKTIWEKAVDYSYRLGYLGAFFMSWLGNSTIIIPFPYTALIFLFGASGLNPLILGIMAGVGATLGESVSYLVGYLGYKATKDKYAGNMEVLRRLIDHRPRFSMFFLFLIGATPIPDDVFMIPLGLIRYNIFRAIIPFAAGKIVLTTIIAVMGYLTGDDTTIGFLEQQREWVNLTTLIGIIIIVYAVIKINWQKIGERLLESSDAKRKNNG